MEEFSIQDTDMTLHGVKITPYSGELVEPVPTPISSVFSFSLCLSSESNRRMERLLSLQERGEAFLSPIRLSGMHGQEADTVGYVKRGEASGEVQLWTVFTAHMDLAEAFGSVVRFER